MSNLAEMEVFALVPNSFKSDRVCPHQRFFSLFQFIHVLSTSPPAAHFPITIISISLTVALSSSVPPYEINYGSIIHPFKHAQTDYFPLFRFRSSKLVGLKRHSAPGGVFFSGAGTEKIGSSGSKNPFRGFSCHNNSSSCSK